MGIRAGCWSNVSNVGRSGPMWVKQILSPSLPPDSVPVGAKGVPDMGACALRVAMLYSLYGQRVLADLPKPKEMKKMARKREATEEKLNYETQVDRVVVSRYTGDGWSDEKKEVIEVVEFKLADLPAVLKANDGDKSIASYGLQSLLQDRTSEVKESAKAKLDAMGEYFTIFKSGVWREYKEGAGQRKSAIDPLFAQAMAELKNVPLAAVLARLQSMTKEERQALHDLEPVQAKIKALKDAAANIDVGF